MDFDTVKRYSCKTGYTLNELLVVMAIIVVLAFLAVPAAKELMKSFESTAGLRIVISAALSNARAIAAKEQKYAGIRFQQDPDGRQYMIFIVHDPAPTPTAADLLIDPFRTGTGLAYGFRALEGKKPMALPKNTGVMDLKIRLNHSDASDPSDTGIISDAEINEVFELSDTTTFSIVFSPTGKLVIHDVRIRNRTGKIDDSGTDDVFNTTNNIDDVDGDGITFGMFDQDDYADLGLGQESSRNCFVLYNQKDFEAVPSFTRWTDYLQNLDVIYVNPHTGEIINK
jgi:prepilin-type N-terminal cleavage/methylation domain-containing protein